MIYLWGFEVDLEPFQIEFYWDTDAASSWTPELVKPPAEAKSNAFPRWGCMVSPLQGSLSFFR